jgi:hypothetical protein
LATRETQPTSAFEDKLHAKVGKTRPVNKIFGVALLKPARSDGKTPLPRRVEAKIESLGGRDLRREERRFPSIEG